MSDYEVKFKDTQALYKRLRWYFERFLDRKPALLDNNVLADLTARDHTVNEWLYDLDKRLRDLEGLMKGSTGAEHEEPIDVALHVNHLPK